MATPLICLRANTRLLVRLASARLSLSGLGGTLMDGDIEANRRPDELHAITRQLEQMSDWKLERGLAASTAFDHDRRSIADRILRARYAGSEAGITLWILVIAMGAGVLRCFYFCVIFGRLGAPLCLRREKYIASSAYVRAAHHISAS